MAVISNFERTAISCTSCGLTFDKFFSISTSMARCHSKDKWKAKLDWEKPLINIRLAIRKSTPQVIFGCNNKQAAKVIIIDRFATLGNRLTYGIQTTVFKVRGPSKQVWSCAVSYLYNISTFPLNSPVIIKVEQSCKCFF